MHRQRTLVASAIVLALVACDGDSGAVDDGPDPQVLWDVYTSYFEAITTADWDTAKSLASGVAFEYVELREELHNISDQTGWVLIADRSDTGPGEVVVLEDGTVAVGGAVRYRQPGREHLGLLDPQDPVFDVTGPEPLLTSWGASISADREDHFALDDRLLTLGEAGGECGFTPLHAYDALPGNPGAVILITIEVCPDTDWQIPNPSASPTKRWGDVTVNEGVDDPFEQRLWSGRGQTDDLIEVTDETNYMHGPPIPGGEPTVILVVMRSVEDRALFSPMRISISLPSGPETFTVPPFLSTVDAIDLVDSELLGDSYLGDGSYTIHEARQAYSADCDCRVIAARISTPEADDVVLFWRAGGRSIVDHVFTVGDAVTRRYSDWGSAAGPGSPMARQVDDAKGTAAGQDVLLAVEP